MGGGRGGTSGGGMRARRAPARPARHALGDRSRPPIAGMTPRKRLRYKSDTVKTGRRSATLCACGTHESRMRSVIIPP
eukprot:scaffold14217_cov120-Isochrysis_galbana.AAC.8